MNDWKLILLVQEHKLLNSTNRRYYGDNARKRGNGYELGQTGTWRLLVLLRHWFSTPSLAHLTMRTSINGVSIRKFTSQITSAATIKTLTPYYGNTAQIEDFRYCFRE
jgi:hypothetical protein